MDDGTRLAFERYSALMPHPIAVACGRILRARTLPEELDAIQRAGEATTRYTAALALASFSARDDISLAAPTGLQDFDGPLSWGHFLAVIQQITALPEGSHPLSNLLRAGFRDATDAAKFSSAALEQMLSIRNEHGHELLTIGQAKAEVIFRQYRPDKLLIEVIESLNALMSLSIFVVEDQQYKGSHVDARRLLLMGESDNPRPETIQLVPGLDETHHVYLGLHEGALDLWPWLSWDLAEKRTTYALFVIHDIGKDIKYISLFGDDVQRNSKLLALVADRRRGGTQALEPVKLSDGRSFAQEWRQQRRAKEKQLGERGTPIHWHELDVSTLRWYAERLSPGVASEDVQETIQAQLLDGREILAPDEIMQMLLLFGRPEQIRPLLKRDLLDCIARRESRGRWDERATINESIIMGLRAAVEFFGRHVGTDGLTVDGLQATSGSADYIAMREALVNLFIHQDYGDPRTVAQIEITKDRAVYYNAGKSLVNETGLIDGGKSTARNPLIARALRLIGFAELAGSGLRALQDEWRQARRRPPRFELSPAANTFTLTLDWRERPVVVDKRWQERLGVKVSPEQTQILELCVDPAGFTDAEIASGTGFYLEDVRSDLAYLKLQSLVTEKKKRYTLRPDLYAVLAGSTDEELRKRKQID